MRSIKFRAWHADSKTMVYFDNKVVAKDHYQAQHLALLMAGEYGDVLMQFTGFTDCNDVEIFGGDIVRDHANQATIGKVKWGFGRWMMDPQPEYRDFLELAERYRLEVIGNIHENPELLTVTIPATQEVGKCT